MKGKIAAIAFGLIAILIFVLTSLSLQNPETKTDNTTTQDTQQTDKSADNSTETKSESTGPKTSFSDGIYQVGVDIQPGVYKTEGVGDSCYYARLSSLAGPDNIIDSNIVNGPATVEILTTDKGFRSSSCGTWSIVQ